METKKQQQTDTPGRKALRQGLKRAAQVYDPIFGDVRVMLGEIDVLVEKIRSRLTMISAEHELRQAEIERIHGCRLLNRHYATAVQMLGQGVQTRLFRSVFQQLGLHLLRRAPPHSPP